VHFTAEMGVKAVGASSKKGSGSGKETLRLKSKGAATFELVILVTVLALLVSGKIQS